MGKTFFAPLVRCIARPQLIMDEVHEFLQHDLGGAEWAHSASSGGELLVEFAGRMCYNSFGAAQGRKTTGEYLSNILEQGHGSVLEHATWSFLVTRCTRGYTHQQVRHRAGWAYSQESTHFVKYGQHARIALPGLKDASPEAIKAADQAARAAVDAYVKLHEDLSETFPEQPKRRKALTGAARSLLPQALESKLVFTANARALRHFCELRGAEDNTVEIRLVASQVLDYMKCEAPSIFADFTESKGQDGYPVLACQHRKV